MSMVILKGPRPLEVHIGQVWRDRDKRQAGREVEVIAIDRARCQAHVVNRANRHHTSVDMVRLRKTYTFVGTLVPDLKATP